VYSLIYFHNTTFIPCVFCTQITKPLSVKLQGKEQDVHCAVKSVNDCIAVMQQIRDNAMFDGVFEAARVVYGEDIVMPR